MTGHKEPLVRLSGNQLITTSLAISQHFEKKHLHVLEAIRNLDCSAAFNKTNFRSISYTDGRQRQKPAFEVTRDGFVFLCMGFTGARAAQWKEAYIHAFNAMERSLQQQATSTLPSVQLRKELLQARPSWSRLVRYKQMGLSHVEIARLFGLNVSTVRKHVRRLEACGLLQPPMDLTIKQQQARIALVQNKGGAA